MEAQQQTGGMPAFLQESGNQFTNWVKNNNMFIIIVLIAIFLGIAFLIFNYFVQPSLSSTYIANNEFTQKGKPIESTGVGETSIPTPPTSTSNMSLDAELYLFYADWCPYSKKLMGEDGKIGPWKKLKQTYPHGEKPGKDSSYALKYIEINGDRDAKSIEHFEKTYLSGAEGIKKKIDGYPSIYLKIEDQIIEYEAEPSYASLVEFIKQIVGSK